MTVPPNFADLAGRCAPHVAWRTMAAIVARESGFRAFAIGDNTAKRSYAPRTYRAAAVLTTRLAAAGHDLDVGLAQVNLRTAARYGVSAGRLLRPCFNLNVAARVLREDYGRSRKAFGSGSPALMRALSAYNSGSFQGAPRYAEAVRREYRALRFFRPSGQR